MFGTLDGTLLKSRLRAKRGKSSQKRRFTLFPCLFPRRQPVLKLRSPNTEDRAGLHRYRAHFLFPLHQELPPECPGASGTALYEGCGRVPAQADNRVGGAILRPQYSFAAGGSPRFRDPRYARSRGVVPQTFPCRRTGRSSPSSKDCEQAPATVRDLSTTEMGRTLYVLKENAESQAQTEQVLETTRVLLRRQPNWWPS